MTDHPHSSDAGMPPAPASETAGESEPARPSRRQLTYLRALAVRSGQTFVYPRTAAAASREIRRLRRLPVSDPVERAIERHDWAGEAAAREANCDVPVRPDEL